MEESKLNRLNSNLKDLNSFVVAFSGGVARIECLPGYLEKILTDPGKKLIVSGLKKIGFRYISLDLEGYRSGSMDQETKEL
jgi:uncharacterized protein